MRVDKIFKIIISIFLVALFLTAVYQHAKIQKIEQQYQEEQVGVAFRVQQVPAGGTGTSTYPGDGHILFGGISTTTPWDYVRLVEGSNITISTTTETITIASTGGGGGGVPDFFQFTNYLTPTTSPMGILATASSTIVGDFFTDLNATTSGIHNIGTLRVNNQEITDFAGTGLTFSGTQLVNVLETTVEPSEMADADFGDWTCSGGTCTVDANAIALGTDTTNNYVATIADDGNLTIDVVGSGAETAAVTLKAHSDIWTNIGNSFIQPTTTLGVVINASSTIIGNFNVQGESTTTGPVTVGNLTATDCDVKALVSVGTLFCGTDGGSGGFGEAWSFFDVTTLDYLQPSTTVGIIVAASSTIQALQVQTTLGVASSSPDFPFVVSGAIYSQQTWDTGTALYPTIYVGASGDESILFWNPKLGAFWAGEYVATTTLSSQVGGASARFGIDNNSTGYASFSIGNSNLALGDYSFAGGDSKCTAGAIGSFCFGKTSINWGDNAVLFGESQTIQTLGDWGGILAGRGNIVNANYGVVIGGITNTAAGENSLVWGENAQTVLGAAISVAFGDGAYGASDSGFVFGENASTTSGFFQYAIGNRAGTVGDASYAIGQNTYAIGAGSMAIGRGVGTADPLVVTAANNLGIGLNSNIPTLTVTAGTGINTVGKVGIGTTTPYGNLSLNAPSGDAPYFVIGSTTEVLNISQSASTFLGVATSSPWRTLSVTGTMAVSGLTSATGGTNNDVCIVSATKELVEETTGVCVVSSRRYKHDIETLTISGLSTISKMRAVSYSPNDDDVADYGDTQYGFIAEELADIDPRLVKYGLDGLPRTLDDRALMSVMLKAIQEQQVQIEELQKEIEKLK